MTSARHTQGPVAATASPLLTRSESALRARPLRSWTTAQKQAVRTRLAVLHGGWHADWIDAGEGAAIREQMQILEQDSESCTSRLLPQAGTRIGWHFVPHAVPHAPAPANLAAGTGPTQKPQASTGQAALHALARRLFSFDPGTCCATDELPVIAPAVARAAWADWLHRLDEALPGFSIDARESAGAPGAARSFPPWSGALRVQWPWCDGLWCLDLPHQAVALLAAATDAERPLPVMATVPLTRLGRALGTHRLTLRATLADAELSLGEIQALRPGDVVALAHPLDAPARLVAVDGEAVCEGWLGRLGQHMALELAALPAGAPPSSTNPGTKEHAP